MLSKMLLACVTLTIAPSLMAQTWDFNVAARRGEINDVDWKGTEFGFAYLFDLNDAVALGPYLNSTSWRVENDATQVKSIADHREIGPEIRFTAPLETLNFIAGASYSIYSKGTAESAGGATAELAVTGLRFKIGLGLPFDSGTDLNVFLIKGLQDVALKGSNAKAKAEMDELALALSLAF